MNVNEQIICAKTELCGGPFSLISPTVNGRVMAL